MKIVLVSSAGGHLAQLLPLAPWWSKHERTWVSFKLPEVESALAGEDVVWAHFPTTRNLFNAFRNFLLAWPTLIRIRPDLVVSDGAGVSVPFFLVAKVLGIRTVYLECFDRISMPTLSGRICYPMTDVFCVQWPQQLHSYPDAVNVGPVL
ncbi:PssD/Cps14F family polysaccharide biosynthesis glycosyltransferase [Specibacter sp. NPDC057265]|uniref:PssD/Cps14F family polysaccharide biosynthesis glycosyltransferase n=1 Tax=Specibacter sp. NPDC057265 TaxID=3346075 RepID=UPI003635DBD5